MMFFKSGSKKKGQRGFTIIELLVALAIFSIISSGVAYTVMQMLNVHASATNRITAIRQVQNAGYWVSQDAQQAQYISTSDNEDTAVTEFLILRWREWEGTMKVVVYTIEDGNMKRSLYSIVENWDEEKDYFEYEVTPSEIPVAQFIDEAGTFCLPKPYNPPESVRTLTLTVTATVGGFRQTSETRVYEIIPRPGL